MIATSHLLPPGKYFIGDPGHVFDDQSWEELVRKSQFFKLDEPITIRGHQVWGGTVAAAKQIFTDQNGIEYRVDDNVLAAVPIELIEDPSGEDRGTVVEAPSGLHVKLEDGVFRFDDIVIDTNGPRDHNIDGGYDLDPADDHFI